jgi:hypothetical protein
MLPMPVEATDVGCARFFALAMNSGTVLAGSLTLTTRSSSLLTTSDTGAKSRRTSYGSLSYSTGLTATAPTLVSHSVVPSGVDRATASAAMAPLPPGLLSTITRVPRCVPSGSAIERATKSTGPPAGKATMMRVRRSPCAHAGPTAGPPSMNSATATAVNKRIMASFPVASPLRAL